MDKTFSNLSCLRKELFNGVVIHLLNNLSCVLLIREQLSF